MIPIGPAPVIRTSSPSTGKESAVWTAFPKGSKIAAISRLIFESWRDRKSTRLNSSHLVMSYAVFCLKKKNITCRENGSYIHHNCATRYVPAVHVQPVHLTHAGDSYDSGVHDGLAQPLALVCRA